MGLDDFRYGLSHEITIKNMQGVGESVVRQMMSPERRRGASGTDRRSAAVFAAAVVPGAPDALTTELALLALVNGIAIG
jgi:hypothetical protein